MVVEDSYVRLWIDFLVRAQKIAEWAQNFARHDIMYDSGIRGAADVVKALALGAKFVFVGRLWVWGLSIMGETGVRHVMKALLADLDILMCVGGFQNVGQICEGGFLGMFC